jgi:cytochrome o ubiquinol oxidase subunit IV
MSNEQKPTPTTLKREHGTTASYVRGFLLSLLFTLIPYYLITEHPVSGTVLLAVIIAFAVLQMVVQVLFFLHLGRERKPYWQTGFLVATVGAIFVVVVGSLWIMNHLHSNMTPVTAADESKKLIEDEGIYQIGGEKTGACQGVHATYKVTFQDGIINPSHIAARLCDNLTFINEENASRYIMFGSPDKPEVYGGQNMVTVTKERAKTLVLNEPGTHLFSDMANGTSGDFTVTPR